jgi:hypothetical protein
MGAGNPYTPSCQSHICADKGNSIKNVTYVLVCKGEHPFSEDMRPWFHQSEGNPIIEKEIYWACEDCIDRCPFNREFQYIKDYKVRGLMS